VRGWLNKAAQPTERVQKLLKTRGIERGQPVSA
jgi:ribosomal protein S16